MKAKINALFKKRPFVFSTLLIGFFILIEFTFSFCSKVHCDGFIDEYFDAWFPYQMGQNLYFQSETGLLDTIKIVRIEKSEPFDQYASKGDCNAYASIRSSNEYNSLVNEFNVSYSKSKTNNFFDLSIKASTFQGNKLNGIGVEGTYKSSYFSSLKINNITFSNVQQIEADTLKRPRGIYKIWIAKNKGLVGYEYFETKKKWNLTPQ